jgi:type I restriction enzyme, S subunit
VPRSGTTAAPEPVIEAPVTLPAEWTAEPLRSVCQFIRDGDWIESKDQGGRDYRLLQISNIGVGAFVETGNYRFITAETFDALRCTEIRPGDVLVARMPKPTGRAWWAGNLEYPAVTAVDVAIIRTDTRRLDARFLAYVLNSPTYLGLASALTTGTTRMRLRRADIERIAVPLPPLDEQVRIRTLLGSLDDKIELNRRMSETLETISSAVFRSWFIDFSGVEEFEDSAIGPIPKGWGVFPVGDVVKVVGGSTPSTKESQYWDGGTFAWATPKDLSGMSVPVLLATSRRITGSGIRTISSGLLPPGTLLLSSRAPIGYTAIAQIPVAVNQGFIAIPPGGLLPTSFMLFWTRSNLDGIKGRAGGTTFPEISKRAFRPLRIVVPPQDRIEAFTDVAEPILQRITTSETESATLRMIRDALLPKLISGELRIPDAERLVSEVT